MRGLKEAFEADYSVGEDKVDDQPERPDDATVSTADSSNQPTQAVAQMAHQKMDCMTRLLPPDVEGYKHDFKEGEAVQEFGLEWLRSEDLLGKVEHCQFDGPIESCMTTMKYYLIWKLRREFLKNSRYRLLYLDEEHRLSAPGVTAIFRMMIKAFANTEIQQRHNGWYRLNGEEGMVYKARERSKWMREQRDGAGGASSPAGRRNPTPGEQYTKVAWDDMTGGERRNAERRFHACIDRHYGLTLIQKDRGRVELQRTYKEADVAKMAANDRELTSVGGSDMVRFVLQHGTFFHKDLLEFVGGFVKEGEHRRVTDEALAKNPDSNGRERARERHITPLLFPIPYNAPPTEIAHRFSNSEQEGGAWVNEHLWAIPFGATWYLACELQFGSPHSLLRSQ